MIRRSDERAGGARRIPRQVLVPLLLLGIVTIAMLAVKLGLDLALGLVAAIIVIGIQRTLGDWLEETFGIVGGNLVLVGVLGTAAWFILTTTGGRTVVDDFFDGAVARGYPTYFIDRTVPPPSSSSAPAVETRLSSSGSAGVRRPARAAAAPSVPAASAGEPSAGTSGGSGDPVRVGLRASPDAPDVRSAISLWAHATSGGRPVPAGRVRFAIDGRVLGDRRLNERGQAVLQVGRLPRGSHRITASVGGNASDSITVTVR